MTEVRAYDSAETTARHSPPSSLQPSVVAGKEFLRFPLGENEARCFAVQYVIWTMAKATSDRKDTKSFRNDNAESEKNYTSVNIPFVSS